ncbi:MAG: hypothetical protein H6719_03150 [Sandaracinaceae bacterium]|nr:hypothetical protein [Sandaracinaceae bacterium]
MVRLARVGGTFGRVVRTLLGLVLLLAASCGPLGAPRATDGSRAVTGQLLYESRHPTVQGASAEIEARPARFVDFALMAGEEVLVEGQTDAEGRFAIDGPARATGLRFFARTRVRGHDAAIASDPSGAETHHMDAPLGEGELAVRALDSTGDAGAFHVVDALLRGLDAVHEWTGQTLPPVFVYWVRGGTREWSFYRGERPAGSGRYALELLGGDPGQQSITDTDEHDEAIILHELGHFVMDRLTSDSSVGGMHPRGARIDPGLAWEEGRASWFALAVLGAPYYRDTIGVEPWGSCRVDEDLEDGPDPLPGLGSETSVTKVLWDLGDDGALDEDHDGLGLGPAPILRAMMAHAAEPGSFASLPSFLRHLVRTGAVTEASLQAALTATGEPVAELLPPEGELAWPVDVAVGEERSGKIDGFTQPAPSGGPNLPVTGFDANHTYRVHVTEPGMLFVRLRIVGTGRAADHTDLTLELRDLRADLIADSRTQEPIEALAHLVTPGWYIVKVRDGGGGNRADYTLELEQETL